MSRFFVALVVLTLVAPARSAAQLTLFEPVEMSALNDFYKIFGAGMQWGNNSGLNGDRELSIQDGQNGRLASKDFGWGPTGSLFDFTFVYDPIGPGTLLDVDGTTVVADPSTSTPEQPGVGLSDINQIFIWQRAGSGTERATLEGVNVTSLDGGTIFAQATKLETLGGGAQTWSLWKLETTQAQLAQGFLVTGQVALANGTANASPNISIKVGMTPTVVPEPTTVILLGTGLVGLGLLARRRRRDEGATDRA